MAIPLAPIIGGVFNLFGNKSKKKAQQAAERQRQAERLQDRQWAVDDQLQQYTRLRDAAEAAGFNPLTALRGGPGAVPQPTGGGAGAVPILSSGEIVADALGAGMESWFNSKQQAADAEKDRLETEILREELRTLQKQSDVVRSRDFGYSIPRAETYSGVDYASNGQTGALASYGPPAPFDPNLPAIWGRADDRPVFRAFGIDFAGSGAFSSGQTYENALGDGPQTWAMAVPATGDALGYTLGTKLSNWWNKKRYYTPPPLAPQNNYYTARHAGPLASFK